MIDDAVPDAVILPRRYNSTVGSHIGICCCQFKALQGVRGGASMVSREYSGAVPLLPGGFTRSRAVSSSAAGR